MQIDHLHPISLQQATASYSKLQQATAIQRELAAKVIASDQFDNIEYIAGMDVSNNPYDPNKIIHATIVVLDKNLQVIETAHVSQQQDFPYITGFLGFREAPALIEAWQKITIKPQLIMVDGHGVSHPRGLGIASHIGVLLDMPTIGVAKNILVGKAKTELGLNAGDQTELLYKEKMIATLLRNKLRTNPLIISSGHKVSQSTAVMVQHYSRGYRLPEPTRQAHLHANECRKKCGEIN